MRSVKTVSCLLALVICTFCASAEKADKRIVGGSLITIEKAPYMVQLRTGGRTFCGGTLVAPQIVISAAHCVRGQDYRSIIVVGGVSTLQETGVQRRISKLVVHPQYDPTTMHSDIAIIKLEQTMTGNNIKAVPLCGHQLKSGNIIQVSGWGRTAGKDPMSNQLRTIFVPVQAYETCQREFTKFVKTNMFCGSGLEAKGICNGDSGGPAIYGGQLCGINAFMYQCGVPGRMSAFTDVYALRSYIEGVIRSM